VRTLLGRLRADDVPIVEEHEESTYGGFKCLDPDGHRVEGCQADFPIASAALCRGRVVKRSGTGRRRAALTTRAAVGATLAGVGDDPGRSHVGSRRTPVEAPEVGPSRMVLAAGRLISSSSLR
jgi:hypothetical protein